jgi:hypothetical protein
MSFGIPISITTTERRSTTNPGEADTALLPDASNTWLEPDQTVGEAFARLLHGLGLTINPSLYRTW